MSLSQLEFPLPRAGAPPPTQYGSLSRAGQAGKMSVFGTEPGGRRAATFKQSQTLGVRIPMFYVLLTCDEDLSLLLFLVKRLEYDR